MKSKDTNQVKQIIKSEKQKFNQKFDNLKYIIQQDDGTTHSVPNGKKSQTWQITEENPDPPIYQVAYFKVLLSI